MQVLRTVLLITGIGLWNTWQGKIKVSCDDGIRRILEHFGGSEDFGRTESKVGHCSSHLLARARQLRDRQRWRVTFFTCSDQQENKPSVNLSLSSPEPSPGFQHLTQQRSQLTPAAQPAPSLLLFPPQLPGCAYRTCSHTHHCSSDPLLLLPGSAVMSLQNMKAEQGFPNGCW